MALRLQKHDRPYRITYQGKEYEFVDYDHSLALRDEALARDISTAHATITIMGHARLPTEDDADTTTSEDITTSEEDETT